MNSRPLSRYSLYRWLTPPGMHARYLRYGYGMAAGLAGQFQTPFDFGAATRVLLCGAGRSATVEAFHAHVRQLSPQARLTLVDLRPEVLARARRKIWPAETLECRAGDALALPFADGAFDWVETDLFFQFIAPADLPRLAAEWRRVLRPGGLVTTRFFTPENRAGEKWFIRRWRFFSWLVSAPCHRHLAGDVEAMFRREFSSVTLQPLPKWPRMCISSLVAVKG